MKRWREWLACYVYPNGATRRYNAIVSAHFDPPLTAGELEHIKQACIDGGTIFLRNTFTANPAVAVHVGRANERDRDDALDAARYRWLRRRNPDHSMNHWKVMESIDGGPVNGWLLIEEALDKAIDEHLNQSSAAEHSVSKEK